MEDPTPPIDRGSRGVRWTLGALAVLAALVGAGIWRAFSVADETIAEHRARFAAESAALAAIPRGRPALLEPTEAGEASAVVRAFEAAVEAVPRAEKERLPPFSYRTTPTPPEGQDEVLAANPAPLAAIAPLLHVPSTPPPPPLDARTMAADLPAHMDGIRWLAAAADRALARGERDAAMLVAIALVTLGHESQRQGTLLHSLLGVSTEAAGLSRVRHCLEGGPLAIDEVRSARRALLGLESSRLPMAGVARVERVVTRGLLAVDEIVPAVSRPPAGWRRLGSWKLYRAEILDRLDRDMDAVERTLPGADDDARAALARLRAAMHVEDPWVEGSLSPWPQWLQGRERNRALLLATASALALAEARAVRGATPSALSDLVPDLLPSVPVDPWTGKPLRFEGDRVWSVGPDGKDDGGTPPANPDDLDHGDLVARVPATR